MKAPLSSYGTVDISTKIVFIPMVLSTKITHSIYESLQKECRILDFQLHKLDIGSLSANEIKREIINRTNSNLMYFWIEGLNASELPNFAQTLARLGMQLEADYIKIFAFGTEGERINKLFPFSIEHIVSSYVQEYLPHEKLPTIAEKISKIHHITKQLRNAFK